MSVERPRRKRPEWRSKVIEDWRLEALRELVVHLYTLRFPGLVPKEMITRIEREPSRATLDRWLSLLAVAASAEEATDALFR